MSAHPSVTGTPWSLFDTTKEELILLARHLDALEPEQYVQYDGQCDRCGTPYFGILDEAKLLYPIGYLSKRLEHKTSRSEVSKTGLIFDLGYSTYESKQLIVKSGLYCSEQLKSFKLTRPFSKHELEVNERAFMSIRPKRCDCDFGSPKLDDVELGILAEFSDPVPTDLLQGPDLDFVSGRPVRTGFRLRSKEAIRRRRKKGSKKDLVVADFISSITRDVIPVPVGRKTNNQIFVVNPIKIKLIFKDDSCLLKHTLGPKKDQQRRNKCDSYHRKVVFPFSPKGDNLKKKYCYFFRKRGYFTISQHNPV